MAKSEIKWPQVKVKPVAPMDAKTQVSLFGLIQANTAAYKPFGLTIEDATALADEMSKVANLFLMKRGIHI